jgi:hypothetical protein
MTPAEAKAVIDELVGRGALSAVIGRAITGMLDELQAWRGKRDEDNAKAAARMQRHRSRTFANVREQPPDTSPARARSSSILEERKIDDDDDTRARDENNLSAEGIADTAERIVKESGHWPLGGWNHAAHIAHIQEHLRRGIGAQVVVDGYRVASARAPAGAIKTFAYFDKQIDRDHAQAMAQLKLPLPVAIGGKASRNDSYIKRRIATAKQAEASDGERSAGGGATAEQPVDTANNG